jgi:hypothetical protein
MFAMAEPITTIWSAPVVFVRLGAGVVPPTDEEPHAVVAIPKFIQLGLLLLSLRPMDQSRHGAPQALEVQVRPLVMTISRFTQMRVPLPVKRFSLLMIGSCAFTVKEKLALLALFMAFFAVTMYRVVVLTSVGIPLTVTKIYSNFRAFVAVKADGSIAAWGSSSDGSTMPPNLANAALIDPSALRAAKAPLFE